jgi:dimethylamine/trimethylamine dehydrogenase
VRRNPRHDILFEPVTIGPKTLRNRFYQVPHCTGFGTDKPRTQARFRATKAEGGWAAVCTEIVAVHPESDRAPEPIGRLWDRDDVDNLTLLCTEAHSHGALVGCELWHAGKHVSGNASREATGAPSQIPSDNYEMTTPRPLSRRDLHDIPGFYAAAALRARDAGFDIIYTYGAHGYLLGQFLSPFYNKRDDEYGGPFANRARLWLDVIAAVRDAVGDDCAVACRISVDARGPAGIGIDEALAFIRLADPLVDLWDVNTGSLADGWLDMTPSRFADEGSQLPYTRPVREATAKPIVTVGRFTSPDLMSEIIAAGTVDLIGAARPSIADPFLPRKIEQGRYDEIRECIGCNICIAKSLGPIHLSCTQNATAGEEYRRGWHPERFTKAANADRDALVIGGGVSGMECAIVLAKRGLRRIHLVEASDSLGGYAALASHLPGLARWRRLVDWRRTQLAALRNVEVILNTRLDDQDALAYGASIVIAATGASWAADGLNAITHEPIPGASLAHTTTPEAVITGACTVNAATIVYDCEGYFMGVGVAELLASRGVPVTLVTPLRLVAPFLDNTLEGPVVRGRLDQLGVTVFADTQLRTVSDTSARLRRYGREWDHPAHHVVLVTARRSATTLAAADSDPTLLAGHGVEAVYRIGDCVAPRLLADAIFDGHRLAREIDAPDPRRALPYVRERGLVSHPADPRRDAPSVAASSR